jgi:hypothetical protein
MLTGRTEQGEEVTLAFSASAPPELPRALEDLTVERIEGTGTAGTALAYRLRTAASEWVILARAVNVHREVAAAFFAAIPPRVPPWPKRLLWHLIVALAASPLGLPLLRRLRG